MGGGNGGGYHGLVDEDKLIVDVTPKIRAVGAEICAFRIVNKHHGETPFEVRPPYHTDLIFYLLTRYREKTKHTRAQLLKEVKEATRLIVLKIRRRKLRNDFSLMTKEFPVVANR